MDQSLVDVFGLNKISAVSIVGAGGKTTLMFRLAGELVKRGHRVLTTTSTKIFRPTPEQSPKLLISKDPAEVIRYADRQCSKAMHLTAATHYDETSAKLLGYAPEDIDKIWHSGRFHTILIEADGAARKPLKAPASHEPVIPGVTSVLIAVIGLDGVGALLTGDHVFRPDQYARLTGLPRGKIITTQSVCRVLLHPKGMMKGCPMKAKRFVFMNKAETASRQASGRTLAQNLLKTARGELNGVLMGSLFNEKVGVESLFYSYD